MLALAFTLSCSDDKDEGQSCSASGALDGTWQKAPNTLKIEGCKITLNIEDPEKGNMVTEGPITYDASKGSFTIDKMKVGENTQDMPKDKQIAETFGYTLSGNDLTFTGVTGDPKMNAVLEGTWTKQQ